MGIKAGTVAVAELEAQRVVAHALPAEHLHAVKLAQRTAAILVAEDVLFAAGLRAGRGRTQRRGGKIRLRAVVPRDGDLGADELDVLRCFHCRIFETNLFIRRRTAN